MGLLVFSWLVAATAAPPQEAPLPPPGAELSGKIEVRAANGQRTPAAGAVVWLPGVAAAASESTSSMASQDKRFEPHVLAVTRGATVAFTNADRIFHNVFSLSQPNDFDLGIYRKGASRSKRFESLGVVRVYCNIHPDMAGFVLVLDTSAFALTEPDGSYRMAGLPPGRYNARVWDERGGERELAVELAASGPSKLDVVLDASGWKPSPHKNKKGMDYPPVTSDADRY